MLPNGDGPARCSSSAWPRVVDDETDTEHRQIERMEAVTRGIDIFMIASAEANIQIPLQLKSFVGLEQSAQPWLFHTFVGGWKNGRVCRSKVDFTINLVGADN